MRSLVTCALALAGAGVLSVGLVSALPAAQATPMSRFVTEVQQYAAERDGSITVAVDDLRTGTVWRYRAGDAQRTASIVKLEILEDVLAQQTGPLDEQRAATARRMIEYSNNTAAQRLWKAIGGAGGLARFGRRVGLTATRPAAARGPGYAWGLTLTTPTDQLRLLQLLRQKNPVLGAGDRRFALRLMRHVTPKQRWGITAGTPSTAQVAVKDGWLALRDDTDWQINSIGWVVDRHHSYLIAVMTTGSPTKAYGIATVSRVSQICRRLLSA